METAVRYEGYVMAVNLKQLEDQISNLSAEQLKQFRMWYDE